MAQLVAECDQAQREYERELDLERERELYPPTEEIEVEKVDAIFCLERVGG